MEKAMDFFSILALISLWIIILFKDKFFGKYLEEKARGLATKEDIGKITYDVESIKSRILREDGILKTKYELKYNACLDALELIDSYFSHSFKNLDDTLPTKQFRSVADARRCHSKLILTCENQILLDKFLEIFFRNQVNEKWLKPPTDLLNEFRSMVRTELGFGEAPMLNRELAWFGSFVGEPTDTSTTRAE